VVVGELRKCRRSRTGEALDSWQHQAPASEQQARHDPTLTRELPEPFVDVEVIRMRIDPSAFASRNAFCELHDAGRNES
jgi:hypothetical protein